MAAAAPMQAGYTEGPARGQRRAGCRLRRLRLARPGGRRSGGRAHLLGLRWRRLRGGRQGRDGQGAEAGRQLPPIPSISRGAQPLLAKRQNPQRRPPRLSDPPRDSPPGLRSRGGGGCRGRALTRRFAAASAASPGQPRRPLRREASGGRRSSPRLWPERPADGGGEAQGRSRGCLGGESPCEGQGGAAEPDRSRAAPQRPGNEPPAPRARPRRRCRPSPRPPRSRQPGAVRSGRRAPPTFRLRWLGAPVRGSDWPPGKAFCAHWLRGGFQRAVRRVVGRGGVRGERVGPCANRVWRSQKGAGSGRAEPERAGPTVVRAGYCRSGVGSPPGNCRAGLGGEGGRRGRGRGARAERGGMMALAHSGLVRGKVAPSGPPGLGRDSLARVPPPEEGGGRGREADGER